MHEQDMAIARALVVVAWADGVFADKEREMIRALLDAYGASDDEVREIAAYAETKRTLEDIELRDLSADDRRTLLQHAVLLTFVDGEQSAEELRFVKALAKKLRLADDEAAALIDAGTTRAKRNLHYLT